MNSVENSTSRASFFKSNAEKRASAKSNIKSKALLKGNDSQRKTEIENTTSRDADVKISDAIKDFAKIKRAVDMAPPIDNSEKIASLKASIANGTYKMNYEAIADKMLNSEL